MDASLLNPRFITARPEGQVPEFAYILKRILLIVPTLLVILVVTFTIVRLLPGDPASAMIGDRSTDSDVTRINAELGLDKPLPVQFFYFVRQVATRNGSHDDHEADQHRRDRARRRG